MSSSLATACENFDAFGGDFRAGAVAADDGDFARAAHDEFMPLSGML